MSKPSNDWTDRQVISYALSQFKTLKGAKAFARYWMLAKSRVSA